MWRQDTHGQRCCGLRKARKTCDVQLNPVQAVVDARSRGAQLEEAARRHVERTALPKV